jgi:2-C-methyl-D-erythritol 4-phosphate cytidylyltransferase
MNTVVIVAGGEGSRMGSSIPKQYLELAGKAMILHTLDKFLQFDPDIIIVLVLAIEHQKYWEAIPSSQKPNKEIIITTGGNTRYESVKNGLSFIENGVITGIHDAVRPFVSIDTIKRCYETARERGSGIPVIEMDETIRRVGPEDKSENLDRSTLRRVQTPQVFRSEMIKKAYARSNDPSFTDDASVFESKYKRVNLVKGNIENIKITSPADYKLASLLMESKR